MELLDALACIVDEQQVVVDPLQLLARSHQFDRLSRGHRLSLALGATTQMEVQRDGLEG